MQVIKRDGVIVEFDPAKIKTAISKANAETMEMSEKQLERIAEKVVQHCKAQEKERLSVEDIQDIVEEVLLDSKFNHTAKAYIVYRSDRSNYRMGKAKLMRDISEKLMATNVVNQNANVDEASFGGRKGEASNELMKWFALNNCMSRKSRDNHLNNEIYIHDLDSYSVGQHNCLSIPFDHLLAEGFNTRQTDIRPASSINTAFQLVAVIFQLQSLQQFGGVSATHLDWTMVPYVRRSFRKHYIDGLRYVAENSEARIEEFSSLVGKDTPIDDETSYGDPDSKEYRYAFNMTVKELNQAVEGMYHNLNTLQSRSGNQLPFTSINYGTCTLPEGRLVIKALLEGSIKGVGKVHKTAIFPCGIFQYMKGINDKPGTPNYDLYQLAQKSTAKRLYPNYANVDWQVDKASLARDRAFKADVISKLSAEDKSKLIKQLKANPYLCDALLLDCTDTEISVRQTATPIEIFSTMGCRTANGYDIHAEDSFVNNIKNVIDHGELYDNITSGAQKDGRGNLCPTTIILPTIAMEAKLQTESEEDRINKFFEMLNIKIAEARDMLIERYDYICSQDPMSAKFMYENNVMLGYVPEEGIRSALRHGTLAIGQLGIAETLQILIGKNQATPEGMELAKRIESLFLDKCNEYKNQYKLNFGVYYTPAENLCNTAMKKFKAKYGVIENVSDRDYFTNSIHVPVWEDVDTFEKIDIEAQLASYSNAGCITYVELEGAVLSNLEALETIINYAMDKHIPYFAINVPNDTCLDCGYTGEFNDCCPVCGSKHIQQLRRVTGYLTGDYETAFNAGKKAEAKDRVKHTGKEL